MQIVLYCIVFYNNVFRFMLLLEINLILSYLILSYLILSYLILSYLILSYLISSRKMRVLGQFTIHMVEFIQLYTDQPHTWLGFRHHPSSSVFQPYIIFYGWAQSQFHGIIRNEPCVVRISGTF